MNVYTAVLGGKTLVKTLKGAVKVDIPKETPNHKVLRLRGLGMPVFGNRNEFGDLFVTVDIQIAGPSYSTGNRPVQKTVGIAEIRIDTYEGDWHMAGLYRFGISLEKALINAFDKHITAQKYKNRSEAIRDLIREELTRKKIAEGGVVAGAVVMTYDHHKRELVNTLLDIQHDFQAPHHFHPARPPRPPPLSRNHRGKGQGARNRESRLFDQIACGGKAGQRERNDGGQVGLPAVRSVVSPATYLLSPVKRSLFCPDGWW